MNRRLASLAVGLLGGLLFVNGPLQASPPVGAPAPAFELPDQKGELHSLADYGGKWLVLYFYPKDDTPGCTTQACEFRDNIFAYRKLGAEIVGISLDSVDSHKAFAEKHGLPFTLLADEAGQTAREYGVLKDYGSAQLAKRETFLISPEGLVARHYDKVNLETHSADVLADIEALAGGS